MNNTDTVDLLEGISQPIEERYLSEKGVFNISDTWEKNQTGIVLETTRFNVIKSGKYEATILWQVEQAP
ncbi:hypothetical protein JZO86_09290 [Enterococcus ureasiticus]|uniref:hypothetical protein n=1 Tax=Enterococcus TaxID=1350 RepID=UPI001A8E8042|nr:MULTISPECIES: hypothetical protein [Enterococcus]MBO0433150.1 hypothetical protein [Enterococcus sp. DIV0849a]MBO0473893.1 hypothetical protein [Enterococcus ureasiticus]